MFYKKGLANRREKQKQKAEKKEKIRRTVKGGSKKKRSVFLWGRVPRALRGREGFGFCCREGN